MHTQLFPSTERGHARHGWLESYHSFSFAQFYNPNLMGFGALRVLNDDVVQPGYGFGTHPHDNMEIISIPLEGALQHKDSTGRDAIISTGDVQMMSAGMGIEHSEKNASHTLPVRFLQIWIVPNERGGKPVYQQISVNNEATDSWQTLVSPQAATGTNMQIRQQAWLSMATAAGNQPLEYQWKGENTGLYLMVLEGEATVNNQLLGRRDAVGITNARMVSVEAKEGTRLLAIEVPV